MRITWDSDVPFSFPKCLASACKGEPLPVVPALQKNRAEASRSGCPAATIRRSQIV